MRGAGQRLEFCRNLTDYGSSSRLEMCNIVGSEAYGSVAEQRQSCLVAGAGTAGPWF